MRRSLDRRTASVVTRSRRTDPRLRRRSTLWVVAVALTGSACATGSTSTGPGDTPPTSVPATCRVDEPVTGTLAPDVRRRADSLVSVFENSTPDVRYDEVEALGDGRGYTAGRAGFTTATGDALLVVRRYVDDVPDSRLERFLPRLRALAAARSASVTGLDGFPAAWRSAARDPRFRAAQDAVSDELYFRPAMDRADAIGATANLTRVALYEAVVQHGDGEDPDGLAALVARATGTAGGTPADGVPESLWLKAFLDVRRADLLDPADATTADTWRASVGRADEMLRIWESCNLDFRGPLTVNPFGTEFTLR